MHQNKTIKLEQRIDQLNAASLIFIVLLITLKLSFLIGAIVRLQLINEHRIRVSKPPCSVFFDFPLAVNQVDLRNSTINSRG
jgi:hypothetical protein